MTVCPCCCCILFPFVNTIATIYKIYSCLQDNSWTFVKNKYDVYTNPFLAYQWSFKLWTRVMEDVPQIVINIIFVYYRNNSELEWINILSMSISTIMLIKELLSCRRECRAMCDVCDVVDSSFNDKSTARAMEDQAGYLDYHAKMDRIKDTY